MFKDASMKEISNKFNTFYNYGVKPTRHFSQLTIDPLKTSDVKLAPSLSKKNKTLLWVSSIAIILLIAFIKRKAIIQFFNSKLRNSIKSSVSEQQNLPSITSQSERVIDTVVKPDNQIKSGLLEEYEKRYSEYKEFVKTVRNRIKTEEEKVEEERLRKAYLSVLEQARKENVSFVRKRVETEFSQDPIKNKEEKLEYIKKEVLGQMKVSEKSAIDGLEMFEKYGSRFEYANGRKSYEYLAESVMYRPKEDLSDRLLSKFIDVWEKISVKDDKKYKDNETLRSVLVHFTDGIKNATEETLLKGISLLKKLTNQREDAERLGYTLLQAPQAQYKDSERIKQAIEDLTQYVKDYPQYYRLPEVL